MIKYYNQSPSAQRNKVIYIMHVKDPVVCVRVQGFQGHQNIPACAGSIRVFRVQIGNSQPYNPKFDPLNVKV